MKRLCLVGLLLLATIVTIQPALADTVLAENPGGHVAFNLIPFGSDAGPTRYQEIYSSSLFSGPVEITSLAFSPRDDIFYSANVELRMTVTNVAVGSLSSDLDTNFVIPLTVVYSNPSFSENLTGGSETFSLVFNFTNPFVYNPADGNLLFDLVISDQNVSEPFSRSGSGDILSRAYNSTGFGDGADGVGLRTLIGYQAAVPEPGTLLLLGIGLLATTASKRRTM